MTTEKIEDTTVADDAAAEQAAAEAAFGQARGQEPAEPQPEAAAPEQSATESEAEVTDEDRAKLESEEWLKGVPAGIRESLSAIAGVSTRLRNVEGHIGGLTSAQKDLKAALSAASSAAVNAGGDAPTDAQVAAAAGSSAKWSQMKEDFPDWAEALEERLAAVRGGGAAVDAGAIGKQVREELAPDLKEVAREARRLAVVDLAHEGWEDTIATPAFSTWLDSQPEEVRVLAESDRPRDAIKLLDTYKASTKKDPPAAAPAEENPRARLEAAVAPTKAHTVARREPDLSEEAAAVAAFKRVRGG